ncbi:MAG: hypothetical protein NC089_04600 [Bacteroides sp.]|nr:hypothetical protein [Bacteroides sp.]MCM1548674.1 hypothetical protein [Clostridium sp.]
MDNNSFSSNNEKNDSQQVTNATPNNPYSNGSQNSGTEQAGVYNTNTAGTYNANATGVYDASQTAYNGAAGGTGSTVPAGFEEEFGKKAKSGMIMGIIALVLNLIVCCIGLLTDYFFSSFWFIILEVVGIQNSIQGRKSEQKKGMATAGMVMNIVALVWSILSLLLILGLKFANI